MTAVLVAESLTVRLGGRAIVDGVSLGLEPGTLTALVGPNGAGKTTLLRALAGLAEAEGDILLDGAPLRQLAPRLRARKIAYLPQGHVFHWPLVVADAVALGRHPYADPFGRPSAGDGEAVRHALEATDTLHLAGRLVTTLSGGERARVALARALATEAAVLLADEPTASLDPRHQLLVMAQLKRTAQGGGAVLAVTHDLGLAARFAARVVVMADGRVVADGAPATALNAHTLADAFGIEAAAVEVDGVVVPVALRPR